MTRKSGDTMINVSSDLPGEDYDPPKMAVDVEVDDDPFSPNNIGPLQLIATMRLYDVGMALLTAKNPDMAEALNAAHEQGKIIGSLPWLEVGEDND